MNYRHLFVAILITVPMIAAAGDPTNGKELYLFGDGGDSQACTACHDDSYFLNPSNVTAKSMAELKGWVQGCNQRFPQGWFPEEEDDVAAFLNREYYRFPQP